jgi:hypothetical protein
VKSVLSTKLLKKTLNASSQKAGKTIPLELFRQTSSRTIDDLIYNFNAVHDKTYNYIFGEFFAYESQKVSSIISLY